MTMKKTIIVIITCVCIAASANAQQGSGRLSLGTGLLYKNGMDITLAYEHEMNYRHRLSTMGRVRFVRAYLPGIILAKLPQLRFWRGLQAVHDAGTQPLWQSAYRSFSRKRHE